MNGDGEIRFILPTYCRYSINEGACVCVSACRFAVHCTNVYGERQDEEVMSKMSTYLMIACGVGKLAR